LTHPTFTVLTDTSSNFALKNNRKKFLIPLIFAAIPLAGVLYSFLKNPKQELTEFNKNHVGLTIVLIFLIFSFGFCSYKYFLDTREKLIISREGVWTPKYGLLQWQSLEHIYLKEIKGKITEQKLLIKLYEKDKEIRLDITYLDRTEEDIINALKTYSQEYNIQFLPKEIQKVY
jgi:hypothetical protein